ncbi:MAG: hypothetical protein PUP90_21520 [Nostoc sp. S4]|nr:hypothetical protein [Nostoc sp. S4]
MTKIIEKKQLDNIATWMIPIKETNLPNVLKGVFFMDGNPLPEDCLTMYNLEWDIHKRTLVLPVSAPLQWTFHSTIYGWLLLRSVQLTRLSYKIEFIDESLQHGQILAFILGVQVPKWVVDATIHQEENSQDIWQRKNLWFGGILRLGEYTLRKIVDENGNYTPAFEPMLAKVQSECLVITRGVNCKHKKEPEI